MPCIHNNVNSGYPQLYHKLSEKVKMNKGVKDISLSRKPVKPKTKCQVAGWGRIENQKTVNDLLVTDVSTINITVCKKEWNKVKEDLPANVLCAGGYQTKSGACQV